MRVQIGRGELPHPIAFFELDRRLQIRAIQPELELQERITATLPRNATVKDQFTLIQQTLGRIKVLKNRFAAGIEDR